MTPEEIITAQIEVARLTHELDITNADHIALWLEANMDDSPLAWLACRIIEAHEASIAAREAAARAEGRREGIEDAAKVFCPSNCAWDSEMQSYAEFFAEQVRALEEKQP